MVINKHMRNREIFNRKLESLESNLTKMSYLLRRQGTKDEYDDMITSCRDLIEQMKSYINMEPVTPNEINRY